MAKIIKIILLLFVVASVGYLIVNEYVGPFIDSSNKPAQSKVQVSKHADGMYLYYFHGNRRCPTCMAIERYSREAAAPYIDNNRLTWKTVNVESSGNKHFIYDFQLKSSGPVIVEYKNDKLQRWKALDKVWLLIRDKEDFTKYMDKEIRRFIQ